MYTVPHGVPHSLPHRVPHSVPHSVPHRRFQSISQSRIGLKSFCSNKAEKRNFLAELILLMCAEAAAVSYGLVKALLRSVAHCGIMGWSLLYARPFWPGPEMRPWQTLAFQRDLFHPPASNSQ